MKISAIDTYALILPVKEIYGGAAGYLEDCRTLIIRVETENGIEGWGEATQGRPGNTYRPSYASPPRIGTRNLVLRPGPDPVAALLQRAGSGIWIEEVLGLHTVDAATGDFSLGASGRLIAKGELGSPVEGLAISGNVIKLLASVEAVGSDLLLFPGGGAAPSVLVRSLSVAGDEAATGDAG